MRDQRSGMKVLTAMLVLALVAITGIVAVVAGGNADSGTANPASPVADRSSVPAPIDVANPVHNYMSGRGRHQSGSCLHAAVEDLLRWDGLDQKADYWRSHFGGAANLVTVVRIADGLGLRHSETSGGDEEFLDYCTANQLGAAIYWEVDEPGDHAIVFCGFDGPDAVLLGTNRPVTSRMPRTEFLARWRNCGGCAFTILP